MVKIKTLSQLHEPTHILFVWGQIELAVEFASLLKQQTHERPYPNPF